MTTEGMIIVLDLSRNIHCINREGKLLNFVFFCTSNACIILKLVKTLNKYFLTDDLTWKGICFRYINKKTFEKILDVYKMIVVHLKKKLNWGIGIALYLIELVLWDRIMIVIEIIGILRVHQLYFLRNHMVQCQGILIWITLFEYNKLKIKFWSQCLLYLLCNCLQTIFPDYLKAFQFPSVGSTSVCEIWLLYVLQVLSVNLILIKIFIIAWNNLFSDTVTLYQCKNYQKCKCFKNIVKEIIQKYAKPHISLNNYDMTFLNFW